MRVLSAIYAEAAHQRRRWYTRHPEARRRLSRPVLSVGNLTLGGSGKTPLVRHLAQILLGHGERPSVLSRGYRRAATTEGVVIVREADRVTAGLAEGGDEPLMLARTLPGAAVLVSPDRHLAGRVAEARLGCTVHILDDGFQHVRLERDLDILVVTGEELEDPRVFPSGRLRERLAVAAGADAIVLAYSTADPELVARRLGVARAFRMVSTLGPPQMLGASGRTIPLGPGARVVAVAAIARPERFTNMLKAAGIAVAAALTFRDHHAFSRADLDEIARQARAHDVSLVVATEKDAVRLQPLLPAGVELAWVPLEVRVEPASTFEAWIMDELAEARARRQGPRRITVPRLV